MQQPRRIAVGQKDSPMTATDLKLKSTEKARLIFPGKQPISSAPPSDMLMFGANLDHAREGCTAVAARKCFGCPSPCGRNPYQWAEACIHSRFLYNRVRRTRLTNTMAWLIFSHLLFSQRAFMQSQSRTRNLTNLVCTLPIYDGSYEKEYRKERCMLRKGEVTTEIRTNTSK